VCEATIGTQTVAAVIAENPFNSVVLPGGQSESGSQLVMIKKSLLTSFASFPNGEPPINITPTIVRGVAAYVLGVNERDGILYITTGNPEAN